MPQIGNIVEANETTEINGEHDQAGRRGLIIGSNAKGDSLFPHVVRWETTGLEDVHADNELNVIA